MTQGKDSTNIMKILWECLGAKDPMLHMLEWLCDQLMEAKLKKGRSSEKIGLRLFLWILH